MPDRPTEPGKTHRPVERLALHRFASPWLRHQHVSRYRWAARFASGKRVLDLACGSGYGSALLTAGGAFRVVSADRSEEAFREATLPGSGAGALLGTVADATRLPFPDGSFDLYVSFETVEHVPDDGAVVREARRVLAPGGVFLCSTPERQVISPGRSLGDRPDNPYHIREYSKEEFASLLRREFAAVEWFGQTPCSDRWKRILGRLARLSPALARKVHQLRNIVRLPVESERRHAPGPLDGSADWSEVLIAACRTGPERP